MKYIRFVRLNFIALSNFLLFAFSIGSCKKFIEVDAPGTNLNAGNVYTTNATAVSVLTDIYANMSGQNINLNSVDLTGFSLYGGLGADELILFNVNNQDLLNAYRNDLTKLTTKPNYWGNIYPQIFKINNAIEGLSASSSLTPSVKQQLMGEAKFMRAFFYFYLVNLYGDIPLVLFTDWKVNALLSRTPKDVVWQQIVTDLVEAQSLLSESYLKGNALTAYSLGSQERVRPTKWAATALLARVYLFIGDWANAETQATIIINNSSLFGLETLANSFLKNKKEAIWQLQPVGNNANSNTGEGKLFILPAGGPNSSNYPVYLNKNLVNAFENGDLRKTNWIDSVKPANVAFYYAKKYKIGNVNTATQEYPTILRLAEQYLIRAEARAQQSNVKGAKDDLFVIRRRAGLSDTTLTANDKTSLLSIILNERQVELFTEWGHRWFDLKRANKLDAVMGTPGGVCAAKGGIWSPYKVYYPIPQTDIDKNVNMIQNPGYN